MSHPAGRPPPDPLTHLLTQLSLAEMFARISNDPKQAADMRVGQSLAKKMKQLQKDRVDALAKKDMERIATVAIEWLDCLETIITRFPEAIPPEKKVIIESMIAERRAIAQGLQDIQITLHQMGIRLAPGP